MRIFALLVILAFSCDSSQFNSGSRGQTKKESPDDESTDQDEDTSSDILIDDPSVGGSDGDGLIIDDGAAIIVGGEAGRRAMVVLLQDTSSSMSSFNSKFGNVVANQVATESEKLDAEFFTCQNSGTKATAINNVFNSMLNEIGVDASNGSGCSQELGQAVEDLEKPVHLILIMISDYTPGEISAIREQSVVESLEKDLKAKAEFQTITFAGVIRSISSYWADFVTENDAVIVDGLGTNAELYELLAEKVKEKSINRVFKLSKSTDASEIDILLNGELLSEDQYSVDGSQLTLDENLELSLGDAIKIEY